MIGFFKKYPHLRLVALYGAFLLAIPFFLPNDYYLSTSSLFVINTLLIVSLMIIIGFAGQISLAHGAIYGIGAYVSAILTTKYGFPFMLSFFAAALSGLIVSVLVGAPSLRLKGHYLAMATLGFGEIIVILFQELDWLTGGVNGFIGIKPADFFGLTFSSLRSYYWLVSALSLIILLFVSLFIDSRVGRALRAIRSSEVAANALGLNPSFYKILAFAVAGTIAGACGSLYAHLDRFIAPSNFSISLSVMLVAMVMVGGEDSFFGALLSAVIFSLLNEYVRQFQELSQLLFGFGLFMASIYLKGGLSGFAERTKEAILIFWRSKDAA